jgi:hypothetical protein
LLSAAGGDDYGRFLYVRLPALRARHFHHQLSLNAAGPMQRIATISDTGGCLAGFPPQ